MKKKLPLIALALFLAAALAIVIKNYSEKKSLQNQYAEYADYIAKNYSKISLQSESESYEYLQKDQTAGLYTIYKFQLFRPNSSDYYGKIIIDSNNTNIELLCAVIKSDDGAQTFVFSDYLPNSQKLNFRSGDKLAVLHHKDGKTLPEWQKLQPLIKNSDVIPNF